MKREKCVRNKIHMCEKIRSTRRSRSSWPGCTSSRWTQRQLALPTRSQRSPGSSASCADTSEVVQQSIHFAKEKKNRLWSICGDELTITQPLGLAVEPHRSLVRGLYHNSATFLALPSTEFPATSNWHDQEWSSLMILPKLNSKRFKTHGQKLTMQHANCRATDINKTK